MIQIESLNKDFCHFSSSTFLNEACSNNKVHKLIKKTRNNGTDLRKSIKATSIEPETIEPTQSTKAYNMFIKVKEDITKKMIRRMETTKDCLFWFLSKFDGAKLALSKYFFILPLHPADKVSTDPFVIINMF